MRAMAEIIEMSTGLSLNSALTAYEVAEKEDFSRVIINASLDGIITYDLEARFTLWSPSMERITGVKSKDVIGRICFDVFPFLKEQGMDVAILKSLRGEAVKSAPISFKIGETGAQGFTEQQNFPLFNEFGEITGGIAIVRDITDLKKNFDAVFEKNRELETRIRDLEKKLENLK